MKSLTIYALAALLVSIAVYSVQAAETTVAPEEVTTAPVETPTAPVAKPKKMLVKMTGLTYRAVRTIKYKRKLGGAKKNTGGVNIYVGGQAVPLVLRANRSKRQVVG